MVSHFDTRMASRRARDVDAPDARQGASPIGPLATAPAQLAGDTVPTRRAQALGRARRPRGSPHALTAIRMQWSAYAVAGVKSDGCGREGGTTDLALGINSHITLQLHAGAALWAGSPRAPASPTPVFKDAAFAVVATFPCS